MTKKEVIAELKKHGIDITNDLPLAVLQQMLDVVKPRQVRKVREANVAQREEREAKEEEEEKLLEPGTYIMSFTLRLEHKDHGIITRHVTDAELTIDSERPQMEVLEEVADKWIAETYHDSQIERVDLLRPRVALRQDVDLREVRNRAEALRYTICPDDANINKNEGQCVLDFIVWTYCQKHPKYTRQMLIQELESVAEPQDADFVNKGVTTRHMMAWAKMKKYVTCMALTPLGDAFDYVIAEEKREVRLVFIVNNGHVYPITDPDLQKLVTRTKNLNFKALTYNKGSIEESEYATLDDVMSPEFTPKGRVVYVETDDLSALLKDVVASTGFMAIGITANKSLIQSFEHPVSGQIYIASPDFLQRKEMCQHYFEETNYVGFRWNNQSWAQLFAALVEFRKGALPVESYGPDSLYIREHYPIGAFVGRTREVMEEEEAQVVSFDICKSYPTALLQNKFPFAIETAFDDVEPFNWTEGKAALPLPVGKAYISKTVMLGGQRVSRGFYPSFFVEYLLQHTSLVLDDVTYIQRASRTLPADHFKSVVRELLEKFPSTGKKAVCPGVGAWGRRFAVTSSVALTDSVEVALGMLKEDSRIQLNEVGPYWFLRREVSEELLFGNVSLREHVVCLGHMQLHAMELEVCDEGTEIIAYNTDSIKVLRPRASFTPVPKSEARPGDICLETRCCIRGRIISTMEDRPEYKGPNRPWTALEKLEAFVSGDAFMGIGQPGCGKSYMLQQLHKQDVEEGMKSVKLCWTKTAAENIGGETLDHFFSNQASFKEWVAKGCSQDVISIDEFTIIPPAKLMVLHAIKRAKPSIIIRMFGGPNQLHAEDYEDRRAGWHEYHKSALMHTLVDGRRIELSYLVATGRYDADLKSKLDSFEATGRLGAFGPKKLFTPAECDFTITLTDARRTAINNQWVSALRPADHVLLGKLCVWKGMYLISHENEKPIVNSKRYVVVEIEGSAVVVSPTDNLKVQHKISSLVLNKVMKYGYADTVMRVISRTIPGRFNIVELDGMSWNEAFVALSRARKADSIGFSYDPTWEFKLDVPPPKGAVIRTESRPFTAYIYDRYDDEDNHYIGSSTDVKRREKQHQAEPVSKKVAAWMSEKGDVIKTRVLESLTCLDMKQLVFREYEWIATIPADKCKNSNGLAIEKITPQFTAKAEVSYSRFNITDCEKEERFRIWWREGGKPKSRSLSYKGRSKQEVLLEVEAERAALIREYYI